MKIPFAMASVMGLIEGMGLAIGVCGKKMHLSASYSTLNKRKASF